MRAAAFQHAGVRLLQHVLALNAFFDDLQIGLQRRAPRLKQLILVVLQLAEQGIGTGGGGHVLMKADGAVARLFGFEATLRCAQAQVALANGLVGGLGGGVVERHQRLSRLDDLAFMHEHLAHDAAAQVLHDLAFGVDGDHALAGHAFVERCETGPQKESTQAQTQRPEPDARGAAGVGGRGQRGLGEGWRNVVGCHGYCEKTFVRPEALAAARQAVAQTAHE